MTKCSQRILPTVYICTYKLNIPRIRNISHKGNALFLNILCQNAQLLSETSSAKIYIYRPILNIILYI